MGVSAWHHPHPEFDPTQPQMPPELLRWNRIMYRVLHNLWCGAELWGFFDIPRPSGFRFPIP